MRKGAIGMDWEQAIWLLNTVPEVLREAKKGVFKRMHQKGSGCVVVETFTNTKGCVLQITKIARGRSRWVMTLANSTNKSWNDFEW